MYIYFYYGFSLKNDDFEYLATEIVKLFPTENIATYYVPPISKKASRVGKSIISRGKLVDKYRNKIRALKVINEWKTSHLDDNTLEHAESDEGNQQLLIKFFTVKKFILFCIYMVYFMLFNQIGTKIVLQLRLLPHLLPPKSRIRLSKNQWKPSIPECKDSIIITTTVSIL
ncbi:uncharacterized protein [Cardiocondyla obscurior]|uniref:uncharacterized protein n=1 Tax=Cardiocondyla obscurior TaxID=286306 RepID=UPI0039657DDC